jgi:acyl carrier protein
MGVDAAKVTTTALFIDDLGADSLDCMELVMAFEEEFQCEIEDEEAMRVFSVSDAYTLVKKKIGEPPK